MRKFKFELLAHTIISIKAEDLNKARRQADVEWHKIFRNGLHGNIKFIKEINEEKTDKLPSQKTTD